MKTISFALCFVTAAACTAPNTKTKDPKETAEASCDGVEGPCLLTEANTWAEVSRTQETAIGNLVVDVMYAEAKRVAQASGDDLDVYLFNGGALRGGPVDPMNFAFINPEDANGRLYPPGPITEEQIRGIIPFDFGDATVEVATISGEQLKRSLESAVRSWADTAKLKYGPDIVAQAGGEFLHVSSALRFEVTCPNTTRMTVITPAGSCNPLGFDTSGCSYGNPNDANSVTRIEVKGEVWLENGAWVNGGAAKTVRIGTSPFVFAGGDLHLDLKFGTNHKSYARKNSDALVAYFNANSPLELKTDGRVKVIGEVDGFACNLPLTCNLSHKSHPSCARAE